MLFSEYSFQMSIEQLQRFGALQKAFDNMMVNIFQEEINRYRQTAITAITNGEYFLIGMIYKSIKSAIYMMHAKDKIKFEQEQKLADIETEQQQVQAMLKLIKALEAVLEHPPQQEDLPKVQKILKLYLHYFKHLKNSLKAACDQRVLTLSTEHLQHMLQSQSLCPSLQRQHLSLCYQMLAILSRHQPELQQRLSALRQIRVQHFLLVYKILEEVTDEYRSLFCTGDVSGLTNKG